MNDHVNITDLSDLGLTEQELFTRMDHNEADAERITAPRYSYWRSVLRVFFRKKINIVILSLLAVLVVSPSSILSSPITARR